MSLPPPIFAFGFASLPLLGWLAVAAAPILIHLWNRRRYREISWGAMEYLMAAVRQQSRRLRFEQWLLLLIRTLVVVLVVLAVAEPYLERAGITQVSHGPTHRVIVVDGSYSMEYKATDKSRFMRAKELARQIVEESAQGDAFTLVLMSSPPRVVVGTPALETSEVVREIDSLQVSHVAADLLATLATATALVQNARRDSPRLTQHEVYFLTDLQRATWAPAWSEEARSEFLRRSEALAEAASLTVIDLGQANAENLAVTNLRALDAVTTVDRAVTFEAVLKRFGRTALRRQAMDLWIDGRRIEQRQVGVSANAEASVAFTYRFTAPGDHAVEVRAAGDALEIDNHRYLAVPVRESFRVLCVDGRPSGIPYRGTADYLTLALAPRDGQRERRLIHPEVATESALLERNLARYDCVFLCNVAQFTDGEARVLDGYLKGGGSVVFFLGDQVQADRYNRELGDGAGEPDGTQVAQGAARVRLLPGRLGGVVDQPQFRLDPLDYRHPIVAAFRGRGQAGLLTTPVFKHFKVEMPADSTAKTVLALGDGAPLIVEQAVHRGRVVLVATSANDLAWTALPLWPSFVPLVQEMAAWCVGAQMQQRNTMVGEPLYLSMAGTSADAPLTVQGPDGRGRAIAADDAGGSNGLTYAETMQSGIYAVRRGTPTASNQVFAVNIDTAESDLAQVDAETLRSEVWAGVPFVHQTSWQDIDKPVAGPLRGRRTLPVDLLYLVLGLLLVETFLAWRFGHHAP